MKAVADRPTRPQAHPDAGATLSKAVRNAAGLLEIRQNALARILGVSPATASRLCAGTYQLSPERGKEWELAVLLVRLFRSLDALLGHGDGATLTHGDHSMRVWHDDATKARPALSINRKTTTQSAPLTETHRSNPKQRPQK